MAKVNTSKAKKVQGVRVDLPITPATIEGSGITGHGTRIRYILRSDGTILRSYQTAIFYTGQTPYWGSQNYKIVGKLKDDVLLSDKFSLAVFARNRYPEATAIIED